MLGALGEATQECGCGVPSALAGGEKQEVLGVAARQRTLENLRQADCVHLVDLRAAGRAAAGQDELAHTLRCLPHDVLRHETAERGAE